MLAEKSSKTFKELKVGGKTNTEAALSYVIPTRSKAHARFLTFGGAAFRSYVIPKGNSLAKEDELGSPKPWPQVDGLCINDGAKDSRNELKPSSVDDGKNPQLLSSEVKSAEKQMPENSGVFKQPRTQKPRAKVPFEKGYSQMDWLKLTHTHPDLAGIKVSSIKRIISMDEVKKHASEGDIWTVLKGRVYNISPYLKFHPGGVDMLMKAAGKDCTSLFNKYHAWVNAEFLLEKCLVGVLDNPN